MSDCTILVENLVKEYAGVTAVNEISFSVKRGEIVGFLGPNGAGKSTTMRILTGFVPATSGKASVCGHCVAAGPGLVRRVIGYMPENNPLPDDFRVGEYLRLRGRLKGVSGPKLRSRLGEVLEVCDLTRAERRIIGTLSKGYRQRVGIADAILAEPPVIIMDEPTIGLDPHQIVLIRDLIGNLRGKMSILLSSHILPEIEMTCDQVIIINNGRIVAADKPPALRREFINRTTYQMEIAGANADIEAAVLSVDRDLTLEWETRAKANGFHALTLVSPGQTDLGEDLIRVLTSTPSLRLRSISRRTPTLEEVFMAATRRSWEILMPPPVDRNGAPDRNEGGRRASTTKPAEKA